ncbi:hypothetical protein ABPG77_002076 [Micractinium sp. CCAP 211/92]
MAAPATTPPTTVLQPAPTVPSLVSPLVGELEAAVASCLEPAAFFVSWQGVLTLAYTGFTQPLINLKQRITAAHSSLPPENPGSKWPKTSLGSLRDGRRLTPDELALLCAICTEESAAAFRQEPQQLQREQQRHEQQALAGGSRTGSSATPPGVTVAGATAAGQAVAEAAAAAFGGAGEADEATGIRLTVDFAAVVLFECRSLERLLSFQPVVFRGGFDAAPPRPGEVARVAAIVAEQDSPDYWYAASKDGHRESHYRGCHLGATLMHPLVLEPWVHEAGEGAGAAVGRAAARPGQHRRGPRELADRQVLLAVISRFRERVDAALPGAYAWFSDASLHITLRALIN